MHNVLERVEHDNGVVTYQSSLLREAGLRHAFTTRIGGISTGPYAKLNLGALTKDDGDHNTSISENFRRLRRAIGCERLVRMELRQVHGANVCLAPPKPVRPDDAPRADAILTDRPGQLLVIRTADCVPILIATHDGKYVGAVHAGWRGIVAGVIRAAIQRLSGTLIAAVGPCISAKHFEVGPEVAELFCKQAVAIGHDEQPHIDLRKLALEQLLDAGVKEIDTTDRCTYRDEQEFFSHRRDVTHRGGQTGRMATVIALGARD